MAEAVLCADDVTLHSDGTSKVLGRSMDRIKLLQVVSSGVISLIVTGS